MWAEEAVPFTSSPIFDEIADRPCMILHTSGSTNHPKPVVWTHRNIAAIDSFHDLSEVGGERAPSLEHHPRNVLFLGYPLFHAAGLNQIMYCIFFGSVPVFAPGFIPLSVSLLETMIDTKILTSAALPPAIIEDAARDTVVFEKLPALDY
jgi:acyl-CoA synthetase (AMP-forming)/AMP-acid ligase II